MLEGYFYKIFTIGCFVTLSRPDFILLQEMVNSRESWHCVMGGALRLSGSPQPGQKSQEQNSTPWKCHGYIFSRTILYSTSHGPCLSWANRTLYVAHSLFLHLQLRVRRPGNCLGHLPLYNLSYLGYRCQSPKRLVKRELKYYYHYWPHNCNT